MKHFCPIILLMLFSYALSAQVLNYPAPAGADLANDFTVTADGLPVPVYEADPFNKYGEKYANIVRPGAEDWDIGLYAYFDFSGSVTVKVQAGYPVSSVTIRPLAYNIQATVNSADNSISFTLNQPRNLSIELNGNEARPLFLFANPVETKKPDPNNPRVRYFAGGQVYTPGTINIANFDTIYVEGGAVVRGTITGEAGAGGVAILGRGIFQNNTTSNLVWIRGDNITLDGPVFVNDADNWSVVLRSGSNYRVNNVKVIGVRRDAMDLCGVSNSVVNNCFLYSTDDRLVFKAITYSYGYPVQNNIVQNTVMWGGGFGVGYESRTDVYRDITFKNVHSLHPRVNTQGVDNPNVNLRMADLAVVTVDRARIKNVRFEDIIIEDPYGTDRVKLLVQSNYASQDNTRGALDSIYFKNIQVIDYNEPNRNPRFVAYGYDADNNIDHVVVDGWTVNGQAATTYDDLYLMTNPYVGSITLVGAPVPPVPANVSATPVSSGKISLAWSDVTGEDKYIVERSLNDTTYNKIKDIPADVTSFTDERLNASTTYYYRIKAQNFAGPSEPSSVVSATTSAPSPDSIPAPPHNLEVVALADDKVGLWWEDQSDNEYGFIIQRSKDGGAFSEVARLGSNKTNYQDRNVSASTYYAYKVFSYNSDGNSAERTGAVTTLAAGVYPEAYYTFNGDGTDYSNNRNPAAIRGGGFVEGKFQYALKLTRSAKEFARIDNHANGEFFTGAYSALTVSMWIKANETSSTQNLLDQGGYGQGTAMRIRSNLLEAAVVRSGTRYTVSAPFTSTDWTHVAITYNQRDIKLYINGAMVASTVATNFTYAWIAPWTNDGGGFGACIGSDAFNVKTTGNHFSGLIDETRVYWKESLNDAEVAQMAAQTPVGTSPNAPGNFSVQAISASQLQFNWSDNSGNEQGFAIEVETANGFANFRNVAANTTSLRVGGFDASKQYKFRVLAYNGDAFSAASNPDSATTYAARAGTGLVKREVYLNITGETVDDLLQNSAYPGSPSKTDTLTLLDAPKNQGSNFGTRTRGYIVPDATGNYTFWISSDDASMLRLSPNTTPSGAVTIARVDDWTSPYEWEKYPVQRSVQVSLTGGQKYYFDIIYKEADGGDHCEVAWQGPDFNRQVVKGQFLMPFVSTTIGDYEVGYTWNRSAEWVTGEVNSSTPNPTVDSKGNQTWAYGRNPGNDNSATWYRSFNLEGRWKGSPVYWDTDDTHPDYTYPSENHHIYQDYLNYWQGASRPVGYIPVVEWRNPVGEAFRLRIDGEIRVAHNRTDTHSETVLAWYNSAANTWAELFKVTKKGGDHSYAIDTVIEVGASDKVVLSSRRVGGSQQLTIQTYDNNLFYSIEGAAIGTNAASFRKATAMNEPGAADTEVSVYPNPATETFALQFPAAIEKVRSLQLIDMGQRARAIEPVYTRHSNTLNISLSGVKPGVYIIKCVADRYYVSKKIVVIR